LAFVINDEKLMEVFELQAEFCKSLADPKRLMIIHELLDGPKSVSEIAERLGLKQSNTSQHLAVLRKAGVIVPDRKGNTIFYSLVTPKIASACDMVREVIAERLHRNQILTNVM
jgi:ArsR family transcriptional regulator